MLNRRGFLGATAAAGLSAQSSSRPNFVILFTDDQRFDTIRALGNNEVSTPNLDKLAARGVAFTHATIMGGTQGAVCVPSRAMLMTGQSLFRAARNTGSTPGDKTPPGPFHLFPEIMRQNGYTTFATGKWHNGPKLFSRCWSGGGNIFFGGMSDQSKTPLQDFDPSGEYPKTRMQAGDRFSSEIFADTAVGFLGRKQEQPFVLYCAFTSPHDPRTAPERFAKMYSPDKVKLPPNFLPQHPFDNGELKVRDEMLAAFPRTESEVRRHIADYYAMVSEVDANIGRVLDAVAASPHAQNTYIIYAGDNGLAVGQHGLMGKQNVYDHSIRVPLMIAGPEIPHGKRSSAFVYTYDVFPTIFNLAKLKVPETVDGESLLPLTLGDNKQGRKSTYHAYRTFQRAVRTRDWKMIRYRVNGQETTQLFNIAKDPWEMHDLAGQAAMANRIKELQAEMAEWQKRTGDNWV